MSSYFCLIFTLCLYFVRAAELHEERYDVIVVGGGLAGLTAADELKDMNKTFIVLEARNRLGGRVHSEFPYVGEDKVLDLGAHYILGAGDNAIYQLSRITKNLGIPKTFSKPVFYTNGSYLNDGDDVTMLLEYSEELGSVSDRFREFNGTYWEFMKRELEYKLRMNHLGDSDIWFSILKKLLAAQHFANDVQDLSTRSLLQYETFKGLKTYTVKGGFKTVLDMMQVNRFADHIRPFKEVVRIEYGDDGVKISCKDGSKYEGEKTVVTLPLGVLKAKKEDFFIPPLPQYKRNAIKTLGFSNLNKIFLEYEKPWWTNDMLGFYVAFDKEMAKELTEKYGKWVLGMVDFNVAEGAPKFLTTWVLGEASTDMEKKSEDEIKAACSEILKKVFPHSSKPIRVIRTMWESDAFSRGSQTYISREADEKGESIADLIKPILNSRNEVVVAFAGEGTSRKHFGTAHGAIVSGFDAVSQLYIENFDF